MINVGFLSPLLVTRRLMNGITPLSSTLVQNHLSFEGAPINTIGFQSVGPAFVLLAFFAFWSRFFGSPCVHVVGLPPLWPYSPSANRASKTFLFSRSGAPRGYFDLPRSLRGPRSARFNRGPRRSTLAAIATGSGVFLITVLNSLRFVPT